MRVLILTCNTGGGHNACAKAIQEVFVENSHSCETSDAISFVSEKLSKFMDWGHTTMYRHIPKLFLATALQKNILRCWMMTRQSTSC